MPKLSKCPCGKTPEDLDILHDADYNFEMASGDCCHTWYVMLEHAFHSRSETYAEAVRVWNEAHRSTN